MHACCMLFRENLSNGHSAKVYQSKIAIQYVLLHHPCISSLHAHIKHLLLASVI